MKTILLAEWLMPAMCDLVVQASQKVHRDYRFVKADNIEGAILSLSEIKPDLVISQPSLLLYETLRMYEALFTIKPTPRLLVWWGNKSALAAFSKHRDYPSTITFVELPCLLDELMHQIDELLI
jgi:hypothetical protein